MARGDIRVDIPRRGRRRRRESKLLQWQDVATEDDLTGFSLRRSDAVKQFGLVKDRTDRAEIDSERTYKGSTISDDADISFGQE